MKIMSIYYDIEANGAIAVMEKNTGEHDKLLHIWQGRTGLVAAVVKAANKFTPDSIEICKAPEGIECPYAGALKAEGLSIQPVDRLQRVLVQATLELAKIQAAGASKRELEAIARAMESKELPASAYAAALAIRHQRCPPYYGASVSKPMSENRLKASQRSANARFKSALSRYKRV
jgi:hypothetical protein